MLRSLARGWRLVFVALISSAQDTRYGPRNQQQRTANQDDTPSRH